MIIFLVNRYIKKLKIKIFEVRVKDISHVNLLFLQLKLQVIQIFWFVDYNIFKDTLVF